ncbi:MAG TPA: aminodeoxychorismate/anthranilate synthase component II [bacterium]|nr:aminodeoxychorismate/anthranilate synthase component II [bacterium]
MPHTRPAVDRTLLLIDNYDSFTFNLVQAFRVLGVQVVVVMNDACRVDALARYQPDYLVISPGPGDPSGAGVSMAAIRHFAGRIPILGVCLGHQCIAEVHGGRVIRSEAPTHGKASAVLHQRQGIFEDLPSPVDCGRYHSLLVDRATLPDCLEVTAWTESGEIMALSHRALPIEGVQFHPESVLTPHGNTLLRNFLEVYR